jgi:hypothetical protein
VPFSLAVKASNPMTIAEHIASLRAELEREYAEKKRLIDDFEQRLLGSGGKLLGASNGKRRPGRPRKHDRPAEATSKTEIAPNGEIGLTEAVKIILQDHKARSSSDVAKAIKATMNVKDPTNKTFAKAVSGALYQLKKGGKAELQNGKYRLL